MGKYNRPNKAKERIGEKSYIEDVRNRLNTGFSGGDVFANTSETPKIVNFSQIRKPGTPEKSRVPSS